MNTPKSVASVASVVPASIDDTAAYLRQSPIPVDVLSVEVPPKVPGRSAFFAQQDLRKLDADLGPEADIALAQLQQLGPDRLAADLGPAASQLRGLPELVQRRDRSVAVVTRLRALVDYVETQQRVCDHDAVLMLENVSEAVGFFGQFDDAMRDRYAATLAVIGARNAKVATGMARARAAAAKPATR